MHRLLTSTILGAAFFFAPDPASAGPVVAAASAAFGAFASSAIGAAVLRIGVSLALSYVAQMLQPKPKQQELRRELAQPDSRPPYRFNYGRTLATGTPAPMDVEGYTLVMGLLFNSRPSAGTNITIYADKRPCTIEAGDLFDFNGGGAILKPEGFRDWDISENYFIAWLQTGDETGPPTALQSAFPGIISAADAWRGRTVLWCRMNAGGNMEKRTDRWPSAPPLIEIAMDWTPIWDPRDAGQDPDNPATWSYSNNQALVLLDALRMNPVRRYPLSQIDVESFKDGADIADQAVALKAGGTEPRYRANGTLAFREGVELLDQLGPIAEAGGGRLVRTGGRVSYAPGAYREPIHSATDLLIEGGVRYEKLRPGRDMPRAIRTSFIRPDADWQEHELPLLTVAGGETPSGDDGVVNQDLSFVTSATQAMRLQKIAARRAAAQETLSCTLPPSAANLVGGANMNLSLPAPWTRFVATWQVESIAPEINASGEAGGVAMRCPVTLRRESSTYYHWTPATDEITLPAVAFNPVINPLAPPGALTVQADSIVDNNGYSQQPRIRFFFPPSTGAADGYEWEVRRNDNAWQVGGRISPETVDAFGQVFGDFFPPQYDASYDLRVRAFQGRNGSGSQRASAWSEVHDVLLDFDLTVNYAISGPESREATFNVTAPGNPAFEGVKIYRATTGAGFGAAFAVSPLFPLAPNATDTLIATGIEPGEADFWAVPVTASGAEAQPTGPYTLTIT